jgi:hypothetical protein
MKRIITITVFSFLLVFLSNEVHAAKRYWIKTSAAKWNDTTNWSATSGGAGGASVPGVNDTAYFNGSGTGNDTLDVNVSVKHLNIASGYTGKIVQGTYTVTIGTTGATLSGGTFEGGSATITISGPSTIAGCAFTSTSGTLICSSSMTFSSGSFTHNNGYVRFTATSTITGALSFYNLQLLPSGTSVYTIASGTTITVNNNFYFQGSAIATIMTGTISLKKDLYAQNTGNATTGGTATIQFTGTGKQYLYGTSTLEAPLCNITVNKSDTLTLVDTICIGGNFIRTSGVVSAGTSCVYLHEVQSATITGNTTFYDLTIFHYINNVVCTISAGTTITVKHNLKINGDNFFTLNTGTINAEGNIYTKNSATNGGGGSGYLNINGSGTQHIYGTEIANGARMCNIKIEKPSTDTLYIHQNLTPLVAWTYVSGIVEATGSTIYFKNSKTISGSHALGNVVFSNSATSTYTIASGTILEIKGDLSFTGSSSLLLNTGTIYARGHVSTTNSHASTAGTATIIINGDGPQTLTGSGTANTGKFPNIQIDKSSGTLTLSSVISVNGHWNYIKGDVDPTNSSVALYGTFNLDGQQEGSSNLMRFYSLGVGTGTRTLTGNIDINNNFTISAGATCNANGNNMNVGGNWNCQGTFTYSTGTVTFDGSSYNTIKGATGTTVGFGNVAFNRGTGSVTLQNPMRVNTSMNITKGRIKTTSTNYLEFVDNATCTTAAHSAYVHGPVRKTGNDAFTFPLGDTTLNDTAAFHPLAITAPGVATDRFEAQYWATQQILGDSIVDTLEYLSTCDYWIVSRQVGSSDVKATIGWNVNCPPHSLADGRAVCWDGNKWVGTGNAAQNVTWPTGTITSSLNLTFISGVATISVAVKKDPYRGYAVLKKKLDGNFYRAYNTLWFKFDDEYNDVAAPLNFTVRDISNNSIVNLSSTNNNTQAVAIGDNRFKLDLFTSTGPLPSGYYILEVTNEKNEKWYLRFKN